MKREKCRPIKIEYVDSKGNTQTESLMIPETIFKYFLCYSKDHDITFGKAIERHVYFSCFKKYPTKVPDWVFECVLFALAIMVVFAATSLMLI